MASTFGCPITLERDLKSYTLRALSPDRLARHDLLDRATVVRILRDHFDGRETNDTLIWSLVVFQTWFDLYVDGMPRPRRQPDTTACSHSVTAEAGHFVIGGAGNVVAGEAGPAAFSRAVSV